MRSFLFGIFAAFAFLHAPGDLQAQLPEPSSAKPLFQDRAFGPTPAPTPTPARKRSNPRDEKSIPIGWIIGGAGVLALATVALLYGSQRAWRSSNLFDRQYHFPVAEEAAVRFGAKKCGGHLATVHFGPVANRQKEEPSKAERA